MDYISTRGQSPAVDSAQAVLSGLAPDGGLYMPGAIPAFDWQHCLALSAQQMSAAILSALLPDIPNMDALVKRAYTGKFETEDLTPTVPVGDFQVLELFRGPTSAAVGRAEPSRVIREPFFSDRVCTVTFSGERASTFSTVSAKPGTVSVGSPAIRSIFTAKPPTCRTFSRAETISAAL